MAKNRNAKARTQVRRNRLLAMLASGEFYSGERLAKRLRISRGGVWKLIHSLQALGEIFAEREISPPTGRMIVTLEQMKSDDSS